MTAYSQKVVEISAALNKSLQQPLRNSVGRQVRDIIDLCGELEMCIQQGTPDLPEMLSKANAIAVTARAMALEIAATEDEL